MRRSDQVPEALDVEHRDLYEELFDATKAGGETGEAAQDVADLLRAHFDREEEFAFPPLKLLVPLANGRISPEMKSVIPVTEKLKAELSSMLAEHRQIVDALRKLIVAAEREKQHRYSRIAGRLILHAQIEEDILYPASILVGEYLKLKLKVEGRSV